MRGHRRVKYSGLKMLANEFREIFINSKHI
uniref:Uncharacterized protein n=1 Tax=Arundo donax TaxID=35708 RepID=A0A0A9BQE2_ARUDO